MRPSGAPPAGVALPTLAELEDRSRGGIAVIGIGNLVMSDDGAGLHALRRLRERYTLPPEVRVVDGGTAGLLLLPYLGAAEKAVLVDAVDLGASPGTLFELDPRGWSDAMARHMSPHDVGLTDLLGAGVLTGDWPDELVVLAVQAGYTRLGLEPTPAVAGALDELADRVAARLIAWGAALHRCSGPVPSG